MGWAEVQWAHLQWSVVSLLGELRAGSSAVFPMHSARVQCSSTKHLYFEETALSFRAIKIRRGNQDFSWIFKYDFSKRCYTVKKKHKKFSKYPWILSVIFPITYVLTVQVIRTMVSKSHCCESIYMPMLAGTGPRCFRGRGRGSPRWRPPWCASESLAEDYSPYLLLMSKYAGWGPANCIFKTFIKWF